LVAEFIYVIICSIFKVVRRSYPAHDHDPTYLPPASEQIHALPHVTRPQGEFTSRLVVNSNALRTKGDWKERGKGPRSTKVWIPFANTSKSTQDVKSSIGNYLLADTVQVSSPDDVSKSLGEDVSGIRDLVLTDDT
jgi:hypothetical protein